MSGETGKWIILAGLVILLAGIVVYFFHDKLHWLGNLPGDIKIERENQILFSLYHHDHYQPYH